MKLIKEIRVEEKQIDGRVETRIYCKSGEVVNGIEPEEKIARSVSYGVGDESKKVQLVDVFIERYIKSGFKKV
ncbi:hypothetical protein [Yersinia intermedia]|uniref:hypothetical protein n=1 Tax=Yersinia intermedia TaxID=631 RepID=UPI00065D7C32|nr:hypothetical protein [Yersinia intermedia]CRY84244.1 Uncharacterised protein [Yersinia intermedia]